MLRPRALLAPGPTDLDQKLVGPPGLVLPGFRARRSPPKRAGYDYLGTPDISQGGTRTRWIDSFTGCTGRAVERIGEPAMRQYPLRENAQLRASCSGMPAARSM